MELHSVTNQPPHVQAVTYTRPVIRAHVDSHADGINGSGSALALANRSAGCIRVYGWACLVRSERVSVLRVLLKRSLHLNYWKVMWAEYGLKSFFSINYKIRHYPSAH